VSVRVALDRTKCQGHGQCVLTCPELFEADEQGFAKLKSADVPAKLEELAQRASLRCPERAIALKR
jgi:ferredoxin